MNFYKLVLPEHLNHHGSLFGGHMLQWIDEFAYIAANLEFPGRQFVTIALDNVEFRHRINNGQILKFDVQLAKQGATSVRYKVKVYGERLEQDRELVLFETHITFVNIDSAGRKTPIFSDSDKGKI